MSRIEWDMSLKGRLCGLAGLAGLPLSYLRFADNPYYL